MTDESPVTQVSWLDPAPFCNWLSRQEKLPPSYRQDARAGWVLLPGATGYRLPSEAEWEYACRAGTTTQYWFGDDPAKLAEYGWYSQNSGGSARSVGLKPANPFGLYDMHGNAEQWCADWLDDKWYAASPTSDPQGPPAGSRRVIRGGDWYYDASHCRSAFRNYNYGPANRLYNLGFRVVRTLEATPLATSAAQAETEQPWNTPAFQQWVKDVAAMPAEKQVEAVNTKLRELNPGFDGKVTPKIDHGMVTQIGFSTDNVTDISPVPALAGLKVLACGGSGLSDLSPLRGMPLTELNLNGCNQLQDLSPLQGMPLTSLSLDVQAHGCQVWDLSPLAAMPLTTLDLNGYNLVRDLTPLRGLPLSSLNLNNCTQLQDLSPLKGMKLTSLSVAGIFGGTQVQDLEPLRGMPLTTLRLGVKVRDLSPLQGMPLDSLDMIGATQVGDLSPLRGMPLTWLNLIHSTQVRDLGPLRGMKLTFLHIGFTQVRDLEPLRGMPLKKLLLNETHVTDLKPLETMQLDLFRLTPKNITTGMDVIRQMKSLKTIDSSETQSWPAAEFWKRYDAGEFGKPDSTNAGAGHKPTSTLSDPAFQQWIKDVAGLSAEKQLEAVVKKLQQLNPGFDGKVTGIDENAAPKIENGVVTELRFATDNVADISPVRALVGLKVLYCSANVPGQNTLADLSPLHGMALTTLHVTRSRVSDLAPLAGMPLTHLYCSRTPISDLSPLKGMQLTALNCGYTNVSDLSPLQGMNLTDLRFPPQKVTKGLDLIRQMKSLKTIGPYDDASVSPVEFWKKYDAGEYGKPASAAGKPDNKPITNITDPAFQQWMKGVANLPAATQVEAVAKKLQELNPGFDGKETHKIENGVVTQFWFSADKVSDLSPVRDLSSLQYLQCNGGSADQRSALADLSPLRGLKLNQLECEYTQVSDLSPLAGMPLSNLRCGVSKVVDLSPVAGMPLSDFECQFTEVADLSPLKGMRPAAIIVASTRVADLSPLKGMALSVLVCSDTPVSDLTPLAGMPLTFLHIENTRVSDLTPLKGMPLTTLRCNNTSVADLSPLTGMKLTSLMFSPGRVTRGIAAIRDMQSFQTINANNVKDFTANEFWKRYDAGEFNK